MLLKTHFERVVVTSRKTPEVNGLFICTKGFGRMEMAIFVHLELTACSSGLEPDSRVVAT